MSFATIMVHVDPRTSGNRVRLAAQLAGRLNATLIGVAGWAPGSHFVAEGVVIEERPSESELQTMRYELETWGKQFRSAVKPIAQAPEWRCELDVPTEVLVRQARAADLIILGNRLTSTEPYRSVDPGAVLLKSGRPVLVVPSDISELRAKSVVIAWKDVREARRALADALTFLRLAERIAIVEIAEERDDGAAHQRIMDVRQYLARHQTTATMKLAVHSGNSISKELLRVAKEENADLIVAGGYGHSRLGEWIFGGVTWDLFNANEVCCLFSH